ncbi:MAG: hypothetical protein RLZZ241_2580 [Bacteroidota bacterium]|jgi:O-antigen/teichoic acid export membrane protein
MSRLALTIKNGWIGMVFHLLYVGAQFLSRNIFLSVLGDVFIGTIETLKSTIKFLNLAELGVGQAVSFSLYKPIHDKNTSKINEIIGYLSFIYKRVGYFMVIAGMVMLPFMPYFFGKSELSYSTVSFQFIILILSNFVTYYFAYPYFLLQADQRGYINNTYSQSSFILKLFLQSLLLIYFQSVIGWILMELLNPIIYVVLVRRKVSKLYPWLDLNLKVTKIIRERNKVLLTKIKQLSIHKIGNFVTNGTDNFIVFAIVNPESVAFLGNYQLIINNLNTLVNTVFDGANSSVGNLVAENKREKMISIFFQLNSLRFFFGGVICFGVYSGLDAFVGAWLGERYILDHTVLMALTIILFIFQIRQPVDNYIQAFGLYSDTWAPLVQSTINLIVSLICAWQFGIVGVLIGTITSQVAIILLWRPVYLFRSGFNLPIKKYYLNFIKHLLFIGLATAAANSALSFWESSDKLNLILVIFHIGVKVGLFGLFYFITLYVLDSHFKAIAIRLGTVLRAKIKTILKR